MVHVPTSDANPEGAADARLPEDFPGGGRVLVAHHDATWRRGLAMILTLRDGLTTVEAGSRGAALEGAGRGVDAALVCLDCPAWDGPSLVRELREVSPEIPIFGLTADPTLEARALAAGATSMFLAATPADQWRTATRVLQRRPA